MGSNLQHDDPAVAYLDALRIANQAADSDVDFRVIAVALLGHAPTNPSVRFLLEAMKQTGATFVVAE